MIHSAYFSAVLSLLFAVLAAGFAKPTEQLIRVPLSDLEANTAAESAVDAYNKKTDNPFLFRLQRLTSASYKVVKPGVRKFEIKFEMKETVCPSKDKMPPKPCAFRTQFDTVLGVCEAEVITEPGSTFKVPLTPSCKLLKPVNEEVVVHTVKCEGCPVSVSPDDPKVKTSAVLALEKYNTDNAENRTFALSKITFATKEITLGEKFWVSFKIQETNCSTRSRPHSLACTPKALGTAVIGDCQAEVLFLFAGPTGQLYRPPKCKLVHPVVEKGIVVSKLTCIGCPVSLNVNDSRVQKSVNSTVTKFNNVSGLPVKFALDRVISATHESIAGEEIAVSLKLTETDCSVGHGITLTKCVLKDSKTAGSAVCHTDQKYDTLGNLVYQNLVCNVTKGGQVKPLTFMEVINYEKDMKKHETEEGAKPVRDHTPVEPVKEKISPGSREKQPPKTPEIGQRESVVTKPKPAPKSDFSDADLLGLM